MSHDILRPANADVEIPPFDVRAQEKELDLQVMLPLSPYSKYTQYPVTRLQREAVKRVISRDEDKLLAERRILGFMASHADELSTGVGYPDMVQELEQIQPPLDRETYLVRLSDYRQRGILHWGASGNVRANVVVASPQEGLA